MPVPAEYEAGQANFQQYCIECHGERALGTDQGPPLVHQYYAPDHHADLAFVNAALGGVRTHHWRFGNMPPVKGITRPEVEAIVGYVRWLQREAGIYEE
jgi:mono/diheme cytochrome c family protein